MSDWSDGGFDFGSLFSGAGDWTSGFDLGNLTADPSWTSGGDLAGGGDGLPPWLQDTQGSDWANGGANPGSGNVMTPGLGSGGGGGFRIPGLGGGSGGGLGGLGSSLSSIFSGNGAGGLGGLASLLPLLASIYGGVQDRNARMDGARQIQEGAEHANTEARDLIGGAAAGFKPYMDAGVGALGKLQAMPPSNLAANFRPIGSGRGMTPGQIVRG